MVRPGKAIVLSTTPVDSQPQQVGTALAIEVILIDSEYPSVLSITE